jgi:hypothetical protein
MTLYTHDPDQPPDICPELTEVDFAMGNAEQLLAAMECNDVVRYTPTRESLTETAQNLQALPVAGTKVIILATDGQPTTCECTRFNEGDGNTIPESCRQGSLVDRDGEMLTPEQAAAYDVVAEAGRIHEEWGITISVIGLNTSDEVQLTAHLQQVADAGGGALYDGVQPTGLADAFVTTVEQVRSCEVELQGQIVAGFEDDGVVTLDGEPLPIVESGGDGYRVVSSSRLELLGEPCEQLKAGGRKLDISFPCDTFEVIR